MIKIHNFRAGFATNSSSSHSIILIPADAVGKVSDRHAFDDYGWGEFVCASQEAKLRYLAAQFVYNSAEDLDAVRAMITQIEEAVPGFSDEFLAGAEVEKTSYGTYLQGVPSVDHQSAYNVDEDLKARVIKMFMDPRVVVLGGNDNADYGSTDEDRPNFPQGIGAKFFEEALTVLTRGSGSTIRTDGDYFVMFDRWNGTKVRFSLDVDNLTAPDYVKASAPELVDVKITDYCTKGCNFCYQSSTTEGLHAPLKDIEEIFDTLRDMKVFEVAIGGGEPTAHPNFIQILEAAANRSIKPNFTTFTNAWLEDEEIVQAVIKNVGGIGVSCTDKKGLALVDEINARLKKAQQWHNVKVMAQHVVGAFPLEVTGVLIDEAFSRKIPVLLLGFKEVGFGAAYKRHDISQVETFLALAVKQYPEGSVSLSVDTALVDQYPGFLESLGVPQALVSSPEGKFSCYIDAVTGTMGPSSYVTKDKMEPFVADVDQFKKAFAAY